MIERAVNPYSPGPNHSRMTDSAVSLPGSTRIGRVNLRVSDLRGVGEFYYDVVGLELIDREETHAILGVEDEPLLELETDETAESRGPDEAGLFHTAFRVPTKEALGEALRRIKSHWRLDGASDHGVSEALYLEDPEGNGVEIYYDRPRKEWPTGPDGRIDMYTDPLDFDALPVPEEWVEAVPHGTDIGHVHLEVSSLERSRDFYVDALGLQVRQAFGEMGLFLAVDDYHHHVGLNTWNDRSVPVRGRGIDWVEFVVPDEETVAGVRERMATADVTVTDSADGIVVRDPDGIGIRITSE